MENGARFHLDEVDLGEARKLVCGVDKGVRFINSTSQEGVVPALVLDGT